MRHLSIAALLIVAACGDSAATTTVTTAAPATTSAPVTTTTTPATTAPATTPPATTVAPTTTADPDAPDVTATATVSGGEVTTDTRRVKVEVGDDVELVVTSDTADELHVHGYDLFADLEPGVTATLRFTADIPGIFEVELESSHVEVFELEVS